jgi:hypothetical protein
MAWLSPGQRNVGAVGLDLHTMLLGALCVLLGYQTLWLWGYAKTYGWTTGLLPPTPFSRWLFSRLSLERGLAAGLLLLAVGLWFNVSLAVEWYGRNLGALEVQVTLRYALWGLTTIVLGLQTVYGSFFLSMLDMGGVNTLRR